MALKFEVANLGELPSSLREHYRPIEGGYRLDVSGLPETPAQLLEGKRKERAARLEAEAEIKRMRTELAKPPSELPPIEPTNVISKQDTEAVYAQKIETGRAQVAAEAQALIESLRRDRDAALLDRTVAEIVGELARPGCQTLLEPHVRDRIEVIDGVPRARQLNGGIAELKEILRETPAFAPIIAGASPAERAAHARRVAEVLGTPPPKPTITRGKLDALPLQKRAGVVRAAEIFDTSTREKV